MEVLESATNIIQFTTMLLNEQKDEKKGPHHSKKHFIYKQDVSPLKACSIIS